MKCVECGAEAQFIYLGSSVCEEHFWKAEAKVREHRVRRMQREKERS